MEEIEKAGHGRERESRVSER
jgi:hypothetical protein